MSRRMSPEEKEGRRLIREAFGVLPLEAWKRTAWWVVDRYGHCALDWLDDDTTAAVREGEG